MLRFHMNLQHPQPRHITKAIEVLRTGGLVVYPTDTTYGMGCDIYAKRSIERIYFIKGLDAKHRLSFICADLSEVSRYAIVENHNYRILRHHVPGPYTFILPAGREVPKILQSNARTVGVRIPESPVCTALVRELGHPIITTTVGRTVDGEGAFTNDPNEVIRLFGRSIEVLLDGGDLHGEPSSVIDLTGDQPVVLRVGAGDLSWLSAI
jgi:tRNA threonylcarbamoyl adenosine modification protein (Sua5/YciO/YrdC/YwlC family)